MKRLVLALFALLLASKSYSQVALYNQLPFYPGTLVTAVAPATPAATSIKASPGNLLSISCFNILATPVYVKLFNATTVTLGTTSASMNLLCPGNTAGAGFTISFAWPASFTTGIQYAVTGGISLTDNTAITATSVIVNFTFL